MKSSEKWLHLWQREYPVSVLGPGKRAVLWTQGCHLACKNCIVPESWGASDVEPTSVEECAEWVVQQPGVEGLTISGGEPMEQAAPLAYLIDLVRRKADLGVICYSGFTFEYLCETATLRQKALLDRIDLLIDGPYIERLHASLLWRGSSNQRLLCLTPRYSKIIEALTPEMDRSAGIQLVVLENGDFGFVGVPPQPRFRQDFQTRMKSAGVTFGRQRDKR